MSLSLSDPGFFLPKHSLILEKDVDETFVQDVIDLLGYPDRRNEIEPNAHARRLMEERYSWEGLSSRYIGLIDQVCA